MARGNNSSPAALPVPAGAEYKPGLLVSLEDELLEAARSGNNERFDSLLRSQDVFVAYPATYNPLKWLSTWLSQTTLGKGVNYLFSPIRRFVQEKHEQVITATAEGGSADILRSILDYQVVKQFFNQVVQRAHFTQQVPQHIFGQDE